MGASTPSVRTGGRSGRGRGPSELERAILLTVLYADIFDYALTEAELYERLLGSASRHRVHNATERLTGVYLAVIQGHVTWRGREHLVALRRRRKKLAAGLWAAADRYGRWLSCVPFVRMVAVSGSLAVENSEDKSDVDLFCITEAGRLWVARLFIVPLSKLTRRLSHHFPLYLCPNTVLALDALEVRQHNLFTAHEVVQAVPLWGSDAYRRFRAANTWVRSFMPHSKARDDGIPTARTRPLLTRACEALLQGRIGDVLDRVVHRLFVTFYRKRAERNGWSWAALESAYQRDRYTVPEGGYVNAVHRLFAERVRTHLGDVVSEAEVEALFAAAGQEGSTCYDWERLFREEYGQGDGPRAAGAT